MASDNKQVVEQHMKAWSSRDVDGIVACFTEDSTFTDLAMQETFEGHAGIRQFAESTFGAFSEFQWTADQMLEDGDRVCTEWHFSALQKIDIPGMPATGKRADIPGVTVDELRDGRIHRHRDYWSLATYLQQIGAMPAPGG